MIKTEKFCIVGIGASAGGLEAIQLLFDYLPDDTGLAFVIVQHLSPGFISLMPELLAKHTAMPIFTAEDNQQIRPNCVYLNQRNKNLCVKEDRLVLLERSPKQNLNLPIDIFFKSIGEEFKENAIGVILSGTGSDGSRGIIAIQENSGTIIVQDPASAQFDGMPNSAISTNLVDYILPPDKIAAVLQKTYSKPVILDAKGQQLQSDEILLQEILAEIRKTTGMDFTGYKRNTIVRRLEKRMNINSIQDLRLYLDFIRQTPQEVISLKQDFLIGVSSFFRNKDAFDLLRSKVFPELVLNKPTNTMLRIWVPGCSTGEEVYSIAILMDEYIKLHQVNIDYKIFATDIDEFAIQHAGAGIYPANIGTEVSRAHLESYFIKIGEQIQIIKRIREKIVFSCHNLLSDPPFIRMDLISCRNLLIYLDNESQKKIFSKFTFALNKNGYLFLGSSESLPNTEKGFAVLENKWKIFQNTLDTKQVPQMGPDSPENRHFVYRSPVQSLFKNRPPIMQASPDLHFHRLLSNAFVPEGVLIDHNHTVLFVTGNTGKRLFIRDGVFDNNLLNMVDADLSALVRTSIRKLKSDNQPVKVNNAARKVDGELMVFDLTFTRVTPPEEDPLYFISFGSEKTPPQGYLELENKPLDSATQHHIHTLEVELKEKQHELQNVVEELETSNEELQSSNEELMASNEELQSTNEELQSVNEELYTVNTELSEKNRELTLLNNDMNNLFNSSDIGTLFIDVRQRIRKFTPAMQRFFNLNEDDIGRTISTFTSTFKAPANDLILKDSQKVLKTFETIERELEGEGSRHYLMRTSPFVTAEKIIDGIIMSFVDITRLHHSQSEINLINDLALNQELDDSIASFTAMAVKKMTEYLDITMASVLLLDEAGKSLTLAAGCQVGQDAMDLLPLPQPLVLRDEPYFSELIHSPKVQLIKEPSQLHKVQALLDIPLSKIRTFLVPLLESGKCLGLLLVETRLDLDQDSIRVYERVAGQVATGIRKIADRKDLSIQQQQFRTMVETTPTAMVISRMGDGQIQFANSKFAALMASTPEKVLHRDISGIFARKDEWEDVVRQILSSTEPPVTELQGIRHNGEVFWVLLSATQIPFGGQDCIFCGMVEITQRKIDAQNLAQSRKELEQTAQDLETSNRTLGVIARSISQYLESNDACQVFASLLQEMLRVTGAAYGFIGEVAGESPVLVPKSFVDHSEHPQTQCPLDTDLKAHLDHLGLTPLSAQVLSQKKTLVHGGKARSGKAKGPGAFLGIPLLRNKTLVGMIGLADRPNGFKKGQDRELNLFTVSCTQLLVDEKNRKAREALQARTSRSVQELRRFIDRANAPIIGIDEQGLINEWNQAAQRISGFSRKDAMEKDLVATFISPSHQDSVRRVLNSALAGKATSNYGLPLTTREGKELQILLNATPRRNIDGKVVGAIGVGQDITELNAYRLELENRVKARTLDLKRAVKSAEDSEENIKAILTSVADGLLAMDKRGRIQLLNPVAEKLLGRSLDQVRGQHIAKALPHPNLITELRTTLKAQAPTRFDFELGSGPQTITLTAATAIIRDKGGRTKGVLAVFRDITYEKQVDRMKTEFLTTAAHELRTPLTTIKGFSELLNTRADLAPAEKERYLGLICKQSKNLSSIIDDLLDVARIEAGRPPDMRMEPVVIAPLLHEVMEPFALSSTGHTLETQVDKEETPILLDREKLSQALGNIISNAIKYSPRGGKIHLTGKKQGQWYEITVRDQGIGMTREQQEKMFDKFYRADASNTAIEGTGLGMGISRHLIEAMGGTIKVQSQVEKGTRVILTFPVYAG